MAYKRFFRYLFMGCFIAVYALSSTSCGGGNGGAVKGKKKLPPVEVSLRFSQPPTLGSTPELILEFKPKLDVPTVEATIELPPQIELLSGELAWHGSMKINEIRMISVSVRIAEPGEYTVSARLRLTGKGFEYGKSTRLNMVVSKEGTRWGPEPFEDLKK